MVATIPFFYATIFLTASFIPVLEKTSTASGGEKILHIPLSELKETSFTIKANKDHLYRIDIMMKNPGIKSQDEFTLVINKINKNNTRKKIAQRTVSGFNIGDPSYYRIDFPELIAKETKLELKILKKNLKDKNLKISLIEKPNKKRTLVANLYFKPQTNPKYALNKAVSKIQKGFANQPEIFIAPLLLSLLI